MSRFAKVYTLEREEICCQGKVGAELRVQDIRGTGYTSKVVLNHHSSLSFACVQMESTDGSSEFA